MAWGKRAGWAAAGLCLAMIFVPPAHADSMVVRVSGPSAKSYPAGTKFGTGGSLTLQAGDIVTLLDSNGTRTLRGPGNFSVSRAVARAPAHNVILSALLDTKRVRRARTGAVRGSVEQAPVAPRRPNLWMVDIAQSGPLCVTDTANVRLWRADAAKAGTLRISGDDVEVTASFAAGEAIAPWPAAAPVRHGAAYRLNDGAQTSDIRFALLGDVPLGLEGAAASLISHECAAQLDLLIDTAAVAGN